MKHLSLVAMLLLTAATSFAQSPVGIQKNQLNVGVGLSEWGVPVYLGFDHGISQDISLGLELSFRSYNENYKSNRYNLHSRVEKL